MIRGPSANAFLVEVLTTFVTVGELLGPWVELVKADRAVTVPPVMTRQCNGLPDEVRLLLNAVGGQDSHDDGSMYCKLSATIVVSEKEDEFQEIDELTR